MDLKMIIDLKIKAKTIKLLEAMQPWVRQSFLKGHGKVLTIKKIY